LSPVSRSPKANDYLFENKQNFEPLKMVIARSPKQSKYQDIQDYEQQLWTHLHSYDKSDRILNSIERATSKKLDTEEGSNSSRTHKTKSISTKDFEGLALDQLLEASLHVDKWNKKYHPHTTQAKEIFNISENYNSENNGGDRYGLKLTPIMSEMSRDSRSGEGRRSHYRKKFHQSCEKKPAGILDEFNPSKLSPRENNPIVPIMKKNYSSFKIDIDNESKIIMPDPFIMKSPLQTDLKKIPSKPLLNRLDRKSSRSGTFIRRPGANDFESLVSSPSVLGNKTGVPEMAKFSEYSEYFQDFVVDGKSPKPLVLSGTRIVGHGLSGHSDHHVIDRKEHGTGKKVEFLRNPKKDLQYKRSRNQLPALGSFTNLDSKSNVFQVEGFENNGNQTMIYQKVSSILQEKEESLENKELNKTNSKHWNARNMRKSVVIENSDSSPGYEVKEVVKILKKSRDGERRPVKELLIPGGNHQNGVRPGDFLKKVVQQQQKSFYN